MPRGNEDRLIDYLPRVLRRRRGFAGLVGLAACIGYGGWDLFVRRDTFAFAALDAVLSGLVVWLVLWYVLSRTTGYFDE